MIQLSEPDLGQRELAYLNECVRDGWVSGDGPFVSRFEKAVAAHHGADMYAACTNSGTTALQLLLMSLGLRPGELVLVPALSFYATLNPVVHCGGRPLVLDVEAETLGIDPALLREYLQTQTIRRQGSCFDRQSGRRIFGLVAVHLYGIPCDIVALRELCDEFKIRLVEDNAEALGASVAGTPTACFGDASMLSFNGNKTVTAGGGGMVLSRDEELIQRVRAWANHGRSKNSDVPVEFGFNYRISNLQAALGLAQFERLTELVAERYSQHLALSKTIQGTGAELLEGRSSDQPTWWLHILQLPGSMQSEPFRRSLLESGIQSRRVFKPFDREELYAEFSRSECCVAGSAWQRCLALPAGSHLSDTQLEHLRGEVLELLQRRQLMVEAV